MKLKVFLFDKLAGYLFSTPNRGVVFAYDEEYVKENGPSLSLSLPLGSKEFSQKECIPYFSGLLPEGAMKRRISEYLHISESSTIKFLQVLGGECSGTVSFYPDEENEIKTRFQWQLSEDNYIPLSLSDLETFIQESKNKPMLLGSKDLRLSLAGAQEKISLAYFNEIWHLPRDGALNKENNLIQRIHQEDFCQAMGIMNDIKYQADGGPSLKSCYNLIKDNFSDSIKHINIFLKAILFNYLIGNCDSHGKNFSLVFNNGKISLAPLYDLLSTTMYPSLTTKMTMKMGNKYEIEKISREDFFKEAENLGIKNRFWLNLIEEFNQKIFSAFDEVCKESTFTQSDELMTKLHDQIKQGLSKLSLR